MAVSAICILNSNTQFQFSGVYQLYLWSIMEMKKVGVTALAFLLVLDLSVCAFAAQYESARGKVTYYNDYSSKACDNTDYPSDRFFAAGGNGNPNIWNNKANCGKYFRIRCAESDRSRCRTSNTISVKIVDLCPNGCNNNKAFDLSQHSFATLADPDLGVLNVEFSGPFNSP